MARTWHGPFENRGRAVGSARSRALRVLSTERAVVLFEFYRRGEAWKVRAIGQGYDDGPAGLARDYGVD